MLPDEWSEMGPDEHEQTDADQLRASDENVLVITGNCLL